MARRNLQLIVLILIGFAAATAASAGSTFTVTLTNGTTFETRYRPVEAEWDAQIVLISTDRGTRIALLKEEIADVSSEVEVTGFGYQLNTTTLFVGWSPNESPDDEEGEDAEGGRQRVDDRFPPAPQSFTLQQFVNPGSTSAEGIGAQIPADVGF